MNRVKAAGKMSEGDGGAGDAAAPSLPEPDVESDREPPRILR
jgi:hypothetical protein